MNEETMAMVDMLSKAMNRYKITGDGLKALYDEGIARHPDLREPFEDIMRTVNENMEKVNG